MPCSVRLPVYTIANIDDIYGRIVAYERLLLPFSDGGGVTHVIASLKTISEDGGFEIKNLMRGNDTLPTAEASRRDRPRPFPPRARPHSGRRRDRIRLAEWNSRAPIPRWSDPSSSAICSTPGCARSAKPRALPALGDYQPDRIADELADMMGFDVDGGGDDARFLITHEGARLTATYGNEHVDPDKRTNRYLDDAIGPERYARVVTLYRVCLMRRRPTYSMSMVQDPDGKDVSYERLLLPFGSADAVEQIVGSYKSHQHRGPLQDQQPDGYHGRKPHP